MAESLNSEQRRVRRGAIMPTSSRNFLKNIVGARGIEPPEYMSDVVLPGARARQQPKRQAAPGAPDDGRPHHDVSLDREALAHLEEEIAELLGENAQQRFAGKAALSDVYVATY